MCSIPPKRRSKTALTGRSALEQRRARNRLWCVVSQNSKSNALHRVVMWITGHSAYDRSNNAHAKRAMKCIDRNVASKCRLVKINPCR
jgi:hypothetical protein